MTNTIIKTISAKDGVVQAGAWIEEADQFVTNYAYILTTDDGITEYFDTDEQLKELCPDSNYFKPVAI